MRLLKRTENGEVILTEHLDDDACPPYAILSHTWGLEEILFEDFVNKRDKNKIGWDKIRFCAEQARRDDFEYFWIDTCCINKAHLTELSEAINSMYRWYREAARCYVYLSDVSSRKRTYEDGTQRAWDSSPLHRTWESSFRGSRWFKRGWTLQELLAPKSVEFFSKEGQLLGSKISLASLIHTITDLPERALDSKVSLSSFSFQERLSWSTKRTTTRSEDRAYCLLGIFGVLMNPIYGERDNAWIRLRNEIKTTYGVALDDATQHLGSEVLITQTTSSNPATSSSRDRNEELLNFLSFEEMDSRRATIKPAYSTTCAWLLRTQTYMDWVDPDQAGQHSGFLWVKGKPGAGKSTLVKYVHAQAITSPQNSEILISYYFNARGGRLEKSTIGMYRSLLYQLLEQTDDLVQVLYDVLGPKFPEPDFSWTIERLREMLTMAVRRLGSRRLKGFIDALDECDAEEIQDMIAHLEQLGQIATGGRFHICFASRHYPLIEIRTGLQLVLEDEHGHAEDLIQYVRSHLKIGKGKSLNKVKDQVQIKANGVFLWAVLVVDILNKEFLRGRVYAVQKRLEEIPERLGDLFREILFRDRESTDELLLCIRWILFAGRPLDQKEFYFAMQAGSMPDALTEWDPEYVCEDDMARFVINCSKGLAELTKASKSNKSHDTPKVQFIHESVSDYLIKDRGLCDLWPEMSGDFEYWSHRQLSECCQRYLKIDLTGVISSAESLPATKFGREYLRHSLLDKFPLLDYSVQQVFYHTKQFAKAMPDTRKKDDPFFTFDLQNWITVANLIKAVGMDRHTHRTSLLCDLAEFGSDRFMKHILNTTPLLWSPSHEKYQHPILATIMNDHWSTLQVFLESSNHPRVNEAMEKLKTLEKMSLGKRTNPLFLALQNGHQLLAKILISCDFVRVNATDSRGRSALYFAAQEAYTEIVKLLLIRGASISRTSGYAGVLPGPAGRGHTEIVKLLLDMGANVSDENECLQNALCTASYGGHVEMVKLLLEKRWTASTSPARYFDGALQAASSRGHVEVMKLLLAAADEVYDSLQSSELQDALCNAAENGHGEAVEVLLATGKANVDLANEYGNTALYGAAVNGQREALQVLLATGNANVDLANEEGDTALHGAAANGCKETVEVLLSTGKAKVDLANKDGNTALHRAARAGRKETVEKLLTIGKANVRITNKYDNTALYEAATNGRKEAAEVLLAIGKANVDLANEYGNTALYGAAANGYKEVVKVLLTKGKANVDLANRYGNTALYIAAMFGHTEKVEVLLSVGKANPGLTNSEGQTGLAVVKASGLLVGNQKTAIVELLREFGSNRTYEGRS